MTSSTGSRVPLLTAEDHPQVEEIFSRVHAAVGAVPNLYRALAHAPSLLGSWIDYAWELRDGARAHRGVRELAILRIAQLTRSEYVWRSHFTAARASGVAEDELVGLADWASNDLFTTAHRAALRLTDELTLGAAASDATWDLIRASFDDREAVELVLTVAWYACVARVNAALKIPLEAADAGVPPLPEASTTSGVAATAE